MENKASEFEIYLRETGNYHNLINAAISTAHNLSGEFKTPSHANCEAIHANCEAMARHYVRRIHGADAPTLAGPIVSSFVWAVAERNYIFAGKKGYLQKGYLQELRWSNLVSDFERWKVNKRMRTYAASIDP